MDMLDRLQELCRSYIPLLRVQEDGDSAQDGLLRAAAELLAGSRAQLGRLPEAHHIRFYQALAPSYAPLACIPAQCVVSFLFDGDARVLPAGERLLLEEDGDGVPLYTLEDAPLGPFPFCQALFCDPHSGCITQIPLDGEAGAARLALPPGGPLARRLDAYAMSFTFDPLAPGEGARIRLLLEGACLPALADASCARWFAARGGEEIPFESTVCADGMLVLEAPEPPVGEEAYTVCVRAVRPDHTAFGSLRAARLAFDGERLSALVLVRGAEVDTAAFTPFPQNVPADEGDCCYIACEEALSRPGARITLSLCAETVKRDFTLEDLYSEVIEYTGEESKPPYVITPVWRESRVLRAVLDYFDGERWKPLPAWRGNEGLFAASGTQRHIRLCFTRPADAQPCEAEDGMVLRHWLRLRVQQAENPLYRPCHCHVPRVRALTVSYSARLDAQTVTCTQNGTHTDFTRFLRDGGEAAFFAPLGERDGGLYLALAPDAFRRAALFFAPAAERSSPLPESGWDYSRADGTFAPLGAAQLEDSTCGLTQAGFLRFSLPEDWGEASVFGQRAAWLHVRRAPCVPPAADCGESTLYSACAPAFFGRGDTPDAQAGDPRWAGPSAGPGAPLYGEDSPIQALLCTPPLAGRAECGERALMEHIRAGLRGAGRSLTAEDLAARLCAAFPEIAHARIEPQTGSVCAMARDFAWQGFVFRLRREAWEAFLREAAPMGLEPVLVPPESVRVRVLLRLRGTARAGLLAALLTRFLHPVTGGPGGQGWPPGRLPQKEDIFRFLEQEDGGLEFDRLVLEYERDKAARAPWREVPVCGGIHIETWEGDAPC